MLLLLLLFEVIALTKLPLHLASNNEEKFFMPGREKLILV